MVELALPFSGSMFGDGKSENARADLRESLQPRAQQAARAHDSDVIGGLSGGGGGSDVVQRIGENYGAGAAAASLMDGESSSSSSRDSLWYRRSVSERKLTQRHPGAERMERGLFTDFPGREKGSSGGSSQRAHTERLQMVGAVDKADGRVAGVQEANVWPGVGDYRRSPGYSLTISANPAQDWMRPVSRFEVQSFASGGESVICTDLEGNITLWNQGAENLFMYKPGEVMGRDLVYLLSPKHMQAEAQQIISRVSRGESLAARAYNVRKDSAIIGTWVTSNPIVDHLDKIIGVIGIYADINSASAAREPLRRSQSSEEFGSELVAEVAPRTGSDDGRNLLSWKRVEVDNEIRSGRESLDGQSSAADSSNFLMVGRTSVQQLLRKLQIGVGGKPDKLVTEDVQRRDLLDSDLFRGNEDYTVAPRGAVEVTQDLSQLYAPAGEATDFSFGVKDGLPPTLGLLPGQQVEREGGGSWGTSGLADVKSAAQIGSLNQPSSRSSSGRSLGSAAGFDLSTQDHPIQTSRSGQVADPGINFQRAEEDFQLQLALALRVAAEAAAVDDPLLVASGRASTGNARWSPGISQMEATAYRYWVSSCLSYEDHIEDGFYEVWGMSPQVWGMCTDSSELGRMPPLENLRAVAVDDASFEVVLIDRSTDPDMIALEDKAVGLAYESSDVLDMASELSIMVSDQMGGPAPSDDALGEAWQASSSKLMQDLESIVLPIGRLEIGLSRHRALLFKVMADSVGLACRLVRGSAFSKKENDASVIVKCSDDREWMVDLLVHPGSRMAPDKLLPSHSSAVVSPLQFGRPNILAGSDVAHWSRGKTEAKSVDNGGDEGLSRSAKEVQHLGFYKRQESKVSGSGRSKESVVEGLKNKGGMVHMYAKGKGQASLNAPPRPPASPVNQTKTKGKGTFFTEELSRSAERLAKEEAMIDQTVGPDIVDKVGSEVQQKMESEIQRRVESEVQMMGQTAQVGLRQKVEMEVQQKVGTEMQQKVHREIQKAGSGRSSRHSVSPKAESAKESESAHAREGKDERQTAGSSESAKSGPGRIFEQLVSDISDFEIIWEDVELGERIGQGSYGKVFRGDWQGSDVAVKVFLDQDLRNEALEEFKSEVALMRRLRHPNVVLFMGAVTKPPNLSIITEFCPRGSLYRLLHRPNRELDDRKRVRMALDVAKGMNYLHRCSPPVVHRDLKSPNLLVDKNWTVKVCDFGLSRQKHSTFLSSKSSAGTRFALFKNCPLDKIETVKQIPEWMAPEVLRNEPSDEKSDVYSFGVILWELATLQVPWNGMNPIQVVGAVGFQHRRLVIPDNIHPAIAAVIQACWRQDTKKRPSFADLMQELKVLQQTPLQIQSPQTPSAGARARPAGGDAE